MWGLDALGIQYSPSTGMVGLPLWAAVVAGGLLAILFVLALVRTGAAGTLMFAALIGFGGWAVWAWTDHTRATERRAFETRLQAAEAAAQAANSPLGCLAGNGNDTLEAACERVLFASAESVAGATAYAGRQVALLGDGLRFVADNGDFAKTLVPLRQTLEQDRYGLVAQALVSRYGCTADRCEAFAYFKDAERIRANMRDNLFGTHVTRASASWGERVAAAPAPATAMTAQPGSAPNGTPLPPGYNLPSASSIPPVSIMQSEPAAAPPAAAPAPPRAAAQQPARRPPPKRPPQRQSEAHPAPPPGTAGMGTNGPVPLSPSRPQ